MDEAEALEITFTELDAALPRLAASVAPPSAINLASGRHCRYVEQHPQQALVLKSVRTLTALTACASTSVISIWPGDTVIEIASSARARAS